MVSLRSRDVGEADTAGEVTSTAKKRPQRSSSRQSRHKSSAKATAEEDTAVSKQPQQDTVIPVRTSRRLRQKSETAQADTADQSSQEAAAAGAVSSQGPDTAQAVLSPSDEKRPVSQAEGAGKSESGGSQDSQPGTAQTGRQTAEDTDVSSGSEPDEDASKDTGRQRPSQASAAKSKLPARTPRSSGSRTRLNPAVEPVSQAKPASQAKPPLPAPRASGSRRLVTAEPPQATPAKPAGAPVADAPAPASQRRVTRATASAAASAATDTTAAAAAADGDDNGADSKTQHEVSEPAETGEPLGAAGEGVEDEGLQVQPSEPAESGSDALEDMEEEELLQASEGADADADEDLEDSQQARLQASDPATAGADVDDAEADAYEAEADEAMEEEAQPSSSEESSSGSEEDDGRNLLGQLAESMWASLGSGFGQASSRQPGAGQKQAACSRARSAGKAALHPTAPNGKAARQAMRGEEEAGPSSHPADEDDVKEMHWEPETGLPAALMADEDASRKVPKLQAGAGDAERPGLPNRAAQRAARKAAPETAGRDWFDLPATPITDDMKRDLRLLRLRGAYDTKRFYKSADQTKFPKYFAMGTVVETPADYYSGRLTNAERKRTLAEELLGDEQLTQMRKKRYNRVQAEKEHWAQKKGRKTDKPRIKKKPHRPKH